MSCCAVNELCSLSTFLCKDLGYPIYAAFSHEDMTLKPLNVAITQAGDIECCKLMIKSVLMTIYSHLRLP